MAARFKQRYGQILALFLLLLLLLGIATGAASVVFENGGGATVIPFVHLGRASTLPALLRSPEFLLLAVTGSMLCGLLPLLPPIHASLLALGCALPFAYLGLTATPGRGAMLPMEFNLMVILMLFAVDVLIGYFREGHMKQQIIAVFGQYIPPQLVDEISRNPRHLDLSGEARNLTVMFCDLQNFSGMAEQLNPRQLALLLNEYFTVMTEVLYTFDATIDKYIGDSIMAFWGAPLPREDHARRAILAALSMQKAIRALSEKFVARGWPSLSMGIGINTGIMNVGNMGSKYRIAYTVVGDAVNLAARLESLTRNYHVPCIVSEATRRAVNGILFRALDVVQVKGKHNRTRIYQPLCPEEDAGPTLREMLRRHRQGMEYYFSDRHEDARKIFAELAGQEKGDGFYRAMLERLG